MSKELKRVFNKKWILGMVGFCAFLSISIGIKEGAYWIIVGNLGLVYSYHFYLFFDQRINPIKGHQNIYKKNTSLVVMLACIILLFIIADKPEAIMLGLAIFSMVLLLVVFFGWLQSRWYFRK